MKIGGAIKAGSIPALVLAVGMSLAAYAQNMEPERHEGPAKSAALKLTLTAVESSVCSNRPLLLELQIENVGQEEIKIDKADLWSSFSYGYLERDSDRLMGRGGGMGTSCSHCREKYISLLPGTAAWEKHEFKLHEFFQDAGDYSLSTRVPYKIGDKELDVESNEIEFEVRSCSSN